jgi:hypothetical protein
MAETEAAIVTLWPIKSDFASASDPMPTLPASNGSRCDHAH